MQSHLEMNESQFDQMVTFGSEQSEELTSAVALNVASLVQSGRIREAIKIKIFLNLVEEQVVDPDNDFFDHFIASYQEADDEEIELLEGGSEEQQRCCFKKQSVVSER